MGDVTLIVHHLGRTAVEGGRGLEREGEERQERHEGRLEEDRRVPSQRLADSFAL